MVNAYSQLNFEGTGSRWHLGATCLQYFPDCLHLHLRLLLHMHLHFLSLDGGGWSNVQCIFTAWLWRKRLQMKFRCHLKSTFPWFVFVFALELDICSKTWIICLSSLRIFVCNKSFISFPPKYFLLFEDLLFPRICVQTSPTCDLTKELNTSVKTLKPCALTCT